MCIALTDLIGRYGIGAKAFRKVEIVTAPEFSGRL